MVIIYLYYIPYICDIDEKTFKILKVQAAIKGVSLKRFIEDHLDKLAEKPINNEDLDNN